MSDKKEDVFVIKKDYVYLGIIGVLVIALAFALTNGFNIQQTTQGQQIVAPTQQAQQPQQANGQSLGPSVDKVVDDDPSLGSSDAPLVIVEFSDFQCPYCRRFYAESFSQIKSNYIDTGKVQFIYRDFPLSFHPMSQKSAEAAECANDQGKFLEFHDKIFDEQNKLGQGTVQYSVDDIKAWAKDIGLNTEQFNSCLDSGKYAQEVQKDFADGSALGVQGTPSFYIAKRGQGGQLLVGAQPYSVFKQVIDGLLAQ
ncbi:MAG: DsbA family protein [Bdellovibrio sp.]|nr:MAG: DsbA family protein [Bdellovibrio sp.]